MSEIKNEIAKVDKKEIEVRYKVDDNEILLTPSIVQKYIVGSDAEITLPEFKFFTELCKARKLKKESSVEKNAGFSLFQQCGFCI